MGILINSALFYCIVASLTVKCDYDLKCYSCNSNYQKCGNDGLFDASVQWPKYCYGRCIKMVIYPGDFIIRACTTFFNSPVNYTLSIAPEDIENECYLATYHDSVSLTNRQAYTCFCQNAAGCNKASPKHMFNFSNKFLTFLLTFYCLVKLDK